MFRSQYAFFMLAPALALGAAACAGDGGAGDQEALEEQTVLVVPRRQPLGTFRNEAPKSGRLTLLVLKSDATYHLSMNVACYSTPWNPCKPETQDGRYNLYYHGASTYMFLHGDDGTLDRYQYWLDGRELRINKVGTTEWTTMSNTTDETWCAIPNDCALQGLPLGLCMSQWSCAANACSYPCHSPIPPE